MSLLLWAAAYGFEVAVYYFVWRHVKKHEKRFPWFHDYGGEFLIILAFLYGTFLLVFLTPRRGDGGHFLLTFIAYIKILRFT